MCQTIFSREIEQLTQIFYYVINFQSFRLSVVCKWGVETGRLQRLGKKASASPSVNYIYTTLQRIVVPVPYTTQSYVTILYLNSRSVI